MATNDQSTRMYHVLRAQQFDREILDNLSELATDIRLLAKAPDGLNFLRSQLGHKRVMLYFTQPSTRTFLSFENACHILGIQTSEIRNPSTSSEIKGETIEDGIRTFSSYVDMIIMRTKREGLAENIAQHLDEAERSIPIINAGSGKDQHPTQALLDIYTLHRSFKERGGIDGKTIVMVGDLSRGRTVRSLCYLMKNYSDVSLIFVAPDKYKMRNDLKDFMEGRSICFQEHDNLKDVVPEADAVYMTRIQDEHDEPGESDVVDLQNFTFRHHFLDMLKPGAIIMHPLPRRDEIDRRVDSDPRAMYWRQVRNGMWMRVALIATIFQVDGPILDYYKNR